MWIYCDKLAFILCSQLAVGKCDQVLTTLVLPIKYNFNVLQLEDLKKKSHQSRSFLSKSNNRTCHEGQNYLGKRGLIHVCKQKVGCGLILRLSEILTFGS